LGALRGKSAVDSELKVTAIAGELSTLDDTEDIAFRSGTLLDLITLPTSPGLSTTTNTTNCIVAIFNWLTFS
jgi:hypothetical protein